MGIGARTIAKLAVAAVLAIAALVVIMSLSQTELLFPTQAVPVAGPIPAGAEQLEVVTSGGDKLHGVHIPPSVRPQVPRTLILGFGGNAWNGQHVAEYLSGLFPEAHVVAFHYRGYHPSTGSPSADALKDDAPLVFDQAVAHVNPDRVILAGFSIGSGVAANLARHRPVNGLILVTPFDSLKLVAADLFPWLPVGPFFQHELAVADDLRQVTAPVAVLAAEQDEIVHPSRTAALRGEVPRLVFDRTIRGAGHNDIYQKEEFEAAMRQALQAVVAGEK